MIYVHKIISIASSVGVWFLLFPVAVSQASHISGHTPGTGGGLQNPLKFGTIEAVLNALLQIIIQVGFPIIVLAIIYTGFLFVKAQGSPEELTKAKTALLWTLIGALIILGALAISQLIQGTVQGITP